MIFFYLFSLTAIASSLIVVTNRKPAYSVLALAVAMLALSALFILLKAYFVAVIQVLIYAGAILVLFLFVIMLLGIGSPEGAERQNEQAIWSKIRKLANFLLIMAFLSELVIIVCALNDAKFVPQNLAGTVEAIGEALFTRYLLPFELVSGILLIGIFGVVNLAQKELDRNA